MGRRIVIAGGDVITMDPGLGDIPGGSVLIEGDTIVAVGSDLEVRDAEVIDASGMIVMPGMVDTHRHTWQALLRGIASDWTLADYLRGIRMTISPQLSAEDVHLGNYLGALDAVAAGVTTILDFANCIVTPEHADAAVGGLRDAGVRAVFAYGFSSFRPPEKDAGFAAHADRLAHAAKVREAHFASDAGLLSFGVSLTEFGVIPFDRTIAEFDTARELDALVTAHTAANPGSLLTSGVDLIHERGRLGPRQIHAHAHACDADELKMIRDTGGAVSCTPETELSWTDAPPAMHRLRDLGMQPSLGTDIPSQVSGDLFATMRLALAVARHEENKAASNRANAAGGDRQHQLIEAREAVQWATEFGAEALGLGARIGSLTPSKQADVVLVDTRRAGWCAAERDTGTLVLQANAGDVDTVLVGGRIRKQRGELVGVDVCTLADRAARARERLLDAVRVQGPLLATTDPGYRREVEEMCLRNLNAGQNIKPSR